MRLPAGSASAKANIPIRIWPSICLTSSLREKRPSRCASIWSRAFCAECKPTPIGSLKSSTKRQAGLPTQALLGIRGVGSGFGGCVDKRQPSIRQRFRNAVEPLDACRDCHLHSSFFAESLALLRQFHRNRRGHVRQFAHGLFGLGLRVVQRGAVQDRRFMRLSGSSPQTTVTDERFNKRS